MIRHSFKLLLLHGLTLCSLCLAASTVFATDISESKPNPNDCLKTSKSRETLIECMEMIFTKLEGKRMILENKAKQKDFDPDSTIDWHTFYIETLEKSREAFENYRKAECTRKEILLSTGKKSEYEKITCQIRITKDRINALQ